MAVDEASIVGSAEPLTPEQRAVRLRELAAWGVDLSLISAYLHRSPTECVEEWRAFRAFADEIERAVESGRVFPPGTATLTSVKQ
jgi:hypothetical protein